MILTQCAVCATELGLTLGKKCGRCNTRYCGPACQVQHWTEGGHDTLCKKIKKTGGAEQFHANQKYAEAVAVAAEACAEDTKGQTCYICTQALHWKTKEGLVRGCSCRGTAGFAHVSCLAEQAKILFAEAEENNLDWEVKNPRWARWFTCSLCEQQYHGVVRCALSWACWKTYLGRPETDDLLLMAMNQLGNGLSDADRHEDAIHVKEVELAMRRRIGASEETILAVQANIAITYEDLGRPEALQMKRDVYHGYLKLHGEAHAHTLQAVTNYSATLITLQRYKEAKSLLRKTVLVARSVLGEGDEVGLGMRANYALALANDPGVTIDDLREAVTTLEEIEPTARRVLGGAHPIAMGIEVQLQNARVALRAREDTAPGGGDVSGGGA